MIKVSVVMPCLNVAGFIEECMESVIGQTLKEIEIIVVDAGSTDGTLEILEKYKEQDNRVRILHSDRKSYGYQMNLGIAEATGEYIGIVETDDIARTDMMEFLYVIAKQEKADYVKGTARGFYPTEAGIEWDFPISPCRELAVQDYVTLNPNEHPILFDSDNFLWNGIYRSEYIKRIKFHETPGAAFQDISALFRIISGASKAIYVNHIVYDYRQNNLSASSYNRKCFQYAATEYEFIQNFFKGLQKEWIQRYYLKLVGLCYDRMLVMASTGEYWEEAESGIRRLQVLLSDGISSGSISWDAYEDVQAEFGRMFLENPRILFNQYVYDFDKTKRALQRIKNRLDKKEFYIWGTGKYGRFLHMYLVINGVSGMLGYCDNNSDIQGMIIQKKPVMQPGDLERMHDKIVVIAMKSHYDEVRMQLIQLGIPEENIECYKEGTNRLLFVNQ